MSDWPKDKAAAERWFAIEYNNEAWSLVESKPLSPPQIERLLNLAHAAMQHWSAAGDSLNRQRALDLLAHAYAAAGRGQQAVPYAEEAHQLSLEHGDRQTSFDRAEAVATMAIALSAAGRSREAATWRDQAIQLAAQLEANERSVIEKLVG